MIFFTFRHFIEMILHPFSHFLFSCFQNIERNSFPLFTGLPTYDQNNFLGFIRRYPNFFS
ncbi:hypothetical protein CY0110_18172 [Crocosphaera chwakensis CCY0110]|uniref:Uncharacterized protein n=1 Tax=Crocosphaera chwakensis CCY0110 TaxID=391612 RepID=A3IIW6_9CHRO|nr:hypothetical protein CY0110_18172 [Crocosphaera chwakensis CCY0110]